MQIGGLIKLSVVDFPGLPAAVVFTQGCNFRCPYCHNKELVIPSSFKKPIPEEEVISFLVSRQGLLSGVVITGGEPTLQKDLFDFMRKVKLLGYKIKLDTNGSRPDILAKVIEGKLADFIAMDIKAPLAKYSLLAGGPFPTQSIVESIEMIKRSGIKYQFRTTLVKTLLDKEDLPKLAALVQDAKSYVLQNFTGREDLIDPALASVGSFEESEFAALKKTWEIAPVYNLDNRQVF